MAIVASLFLSSQLFMLQTIAELTAQLNEKSFELEVIYPVDMNMISLVFVLLTMCFITI